ncbi:transposable element Tcb2 transposase [Trichonephila clavipes]|nr:transposable element Tcb2 transposase [Trichonephila clavipes]
MWTSGERYVVIIYSQTKFLTIFYDYRRNSKDVYLLFFISDKSASVMKANLKFCRTKLSLCVVVVEKKFHSDCVVQTVKHPTKIMIWSVISGKGTGRLYVVKGMMRQDQYTDVLQNRLIPQLEEWFPNGEPYIFMQDEAPCHTTRSIKVFLAEQNIPLLDWPDNIPDMNPIENVWELMKRKMAKDVITNKPQLLERIIHVWNHPPQV